MPLDALLGLLQCPSCRTPDEDALRLGGARRPELLCTGCGTHYPVVDGIPDMVPPGPQRVKAYRTETLDNLIAGTYALTFPAMSLAVWRCDPLRFVDFTHMALGRAQGGWHLSLPASTGWLPRHVWGPHLDVRFVGADLSWNMLRKARRRFEHAGMSASLVRADVEHLPFRDSAFDSILSVNGLHGFDRRGGALRELYRTLQPHGLLAGSTLIRQQVGLADRVLDAYERYGVTPMLRRKEFVVSELRELGAVRVLFESSGAVLFFTVEAEREAHASA